MGHFDLAVRVLMLSYAFDVLDGWLARRYGGSTREGLMLDRAFDRVSQVLAPLALYTAWYTSTPHTRVDEALLAAYASGLVAVAFWRLVRRIVWTLQYFAGLPMFAHAGVLLLSYIAKSPVHPALLLALLLASAVPIPYLRRLTPKSSTPSPATPARLAIVLALAIIPYNSHIVAAAARALLAAIIAYAIAGPIPPLLWRRKTKTPPPQQS